MTVVNTLLRTHQMLVRQEWRSKRLDQDHFEHVDDREEAGVPHLPWVNGAR